MKKLFVLFLCLVAVFTVVSCKNEPEEEAKPNNKPEPVLVPATEAEILAGTAFYRLTATVTAKRFSLQYLDEDGGTFDPKIGDVLTLKYRTNHAVSCFFLRDSSSKNNYIPAEDLATDKKYHNISESGDSYVTGPDADGWYTFTFTFSTENSGFRIELANYNSNAKFKPDDYLDIRDLKFNDQRLTIEEPDIDKGESETDHGIWNDGYEPEKTDQTWPTLAIYYL